MTDIQRIWISKIIQKEKKEIDRKARLEATRQRVFGRSRRR